MRKLNRNSSFPQKWLNSTDVAITLKELVTTASRYDTTTTTTTKGVVEDFGRSCYSHSSVTALLTRNNKGRLFLKA